MVRRYQISLRLTLIAVLVFALSLALLKLNASVHSVILGVSGFGLLGVSIGWPIGYLVGRRQGAVVGGALGLILLYVSMIVYGVITLLNTPTF